MAPFLQRFISASASPSGPPPFPPKPPFPSNSLSVKPQSDDDQQQLRCNILRRDFAALALLALAPARSLARPSPAAAFSIGIFRDSDYTNKDLEEVLRLSKSAARDCVPQDRNSFVNFQANTGVEVCTFKLIVKNAASLLADKDPVKLEAEAILDNLIRSFSSLNGLANEMDLQPTSNSRQRAVDALKDTISSLDKFEQAIKDCLEV
ncbi:hypothetical protein CRG98_045323 [Punica granatum]|uniref:Uncharacterized protein n=1 Tax=Punica granatum TaxID=22663 RepID=A0A2I0HRE7_PUNGR|nr:hypothetical protein CRG98_045323 [Punica granatum]